MTLPFERVGDGGENFGTMNEAIAYYFPDLLEETRGIPANDRELVANIPTSDGSIIIPAGQLESVTPAEQDGFFEVHLKGTIAASVVTGAALLGAYIRYRRKG